MLDVNLATSRLCWGANKSSGHQHSCANRVAYTLCPVRLPQLGAWGGETYPFPLNQLAMALLSRGLEEVKAEPLLSSSSSLAQR